MIYKINYNFQGKGSVTIEADNKEQAEDKFYNGEFENEDEGESENYEIDLVTLIN